MLMWEDGGVRPEGRALWERDLVSRGEDCGWDDW